MPHVVVFVAAQAVSSLTTAGTFTATCTVHKMHNAPQSHTTVPYLFNIKPKLDITLSLRTKTALTRNISVVSVLFHPESCPWANRPGGKCSECIQSLDGICTLRGCVLVRCVPVIGILGHSHPALFASQLFVCNYNWGTRFFNLDSKPYAIYAMPLIPKTTSYVHLNWLAQIRT